MTRNFEDAYERTAQIEGFYVNNPNDNGGETYCGIARKFHPNGKGWKHIDWGKTRYGQPKGNTRFTKLDESVKLFYYNIFGKNLRLDELPNDISKMMYDTAVNMGSHTAITFLQRALNVSNIKETKGEDLKVDGVIGMKTISVVHLLHRTYPKKWKEVKIGYTCLKGYHYIDIMEKNESQEVFSSSWVTRVKFEER